MHFYRQEKQKTFVYLAGYSQYNIYYLYLILQNELANVII